MLPQTARNNGPNFFQPVDSTAHDGLYPPSMTLPIPHLHPPPPPPPLPRGPQQIPHQDAQMQSVPLSRPLGPPQFAYPVRLNPSSKLLVASGAHLTEGLEITNSSEHMLRRKTPNGTLAAGYDGTPVQWSTESPPSKHVVLPLSVISAESNLTATQRLEDALSRRERNGDCSYQQYPQAQSDSTDALRDTSGRRGTWTRAPDLFPGDQTMFDDTTIHQGDMLFVNNGMQTPTVLQPPYQPCLGPTASNDPGSYGPYYADGRFEAYRPAAMRDNRHHSFNFCSGPFKGMSLASQGLPGVHEYQHSNSNTYNSSPFVQQSHIGTSQEQTGYTNSVTPNYDSVHYPTAREIPIPVHPAPAQSNSSYDRIPLGLRSHDAQFKEKILAWAHTVYVDLLASIHQSKRKAHQALKKQGLHRSYSLTSVYPKPPRQSAFLLRGPSYPAYHSDGTHENSLHEYGQASTSSALHAHRRRSNSLAGIMEDRRSFGSRASLSRSSLDRPHFIPSYYGGGQGQSPLSLYLDTIPQRGSVKDTAKSALEMLYNLCQESGWRWIDGMLLGGCLAYGLEDYETALEWYSKIIAIDSSHVEAISNLAAALLSLNRQEEAEQHWLRSVKLRPCYFEAVEHLVALLCGDHRSIEAIGIIDFVERSLRLSTFYDHDRESDTSSDGGRSSSSSYASSEYGASDFDLPPVNHSFSAAHCDDVSKQPGFGSSGYAIAGSDNGRMLALIHAKGNMLHALHDINAASRAFEDAVLVSVGRRVKGIHGLIRTILDALPALEGETLAGCRSTFGMPATTTIGLMPVLLPPDKALRTASMIFSKYGQLPGLRYIPQGAAKASAISTTSNSLLSLAKIFQDSMTSPSPRGTLRPCGTGDILALYYLSLSLQPSPSTANNIGILLASIPQQVSDRKPHVMDAEPVLTIPGVKPGSGVALAFAYYNYGLNLDSRHAHLYTNLGSLLKDMGRLAAAIKMYEKAVACDGHFDIALANLANAVKDQGRINDAIEYYKRAVESNPDFAEAVCGLSNALNSVCDWTGRGGVILGGTKHDRWHVGDDGMLSDATVSGIGSGWMKRVVAIVGRQLEDGANWGRGALQGHALQSMLQELEIADTGGQWSRDKAMNMHTRLKSWIGKPWEGARLVRLVERAIKRAMRRWYQDKYVRGQSLPHLKYARPHLPSILSIPGAPTVLPFHTFTCPLSAKDIRMISQRNALRISMATARAPWLPPTVYPPPPPPSPNLNIGYVSSDFNNHPLAHLMQSVFGMHDPLKARAICYATSPSDSSIHRKQIEREAPVFRDASSWSADRLVQQIVQDNIHILVNLNGYTRGAKNEVFAARPAPIQMSFMGFAGTLGAEWCDYLLADDTAIPPRTLRPWRRNIDLEDQHRADESNDEEHWVYSENIIFCRDTFFCCDHRQSSGDQQLPWCEEQQRRWRMRKELFPDLSDETIILGNFNQLYKIEPTTFRTWLRILSKVPKAVLWLLRFPDLGESNLRRTARLWAGEEVASRIIFTDVAPKHQHISRGRICDLFLDTAECNAHTTAADILWSSTPLLTLPRYEYKMCSRMAASILKGALPRSDEGLRAASDLIAGDEDQYEEFAVKLATGLTYDSSGIGRGRLSELRQLLYESRCTSALFDTQRWVRDLERAYGEAWRRWVEGIGGDIYL